MSEIIGGEFAINPNLMIFEKYFQPEKDEYLYMSGRSAFYYILKNINNNYPVIDTILLPDYLCSSIIDVVQKANYNYIFYTVSEILMPDINSLLNFSTENSCILLINYFGLLNIEPIITDLKNFIPGICIILDNVQALFEMRQKTQANYSFASLRKWIPVPDGAIVKTSEKGMLSPDQINTSCQWKLAAGLLKIYRAFPEIEDSLYLDFSKKGEELLEIYYDHQCSNITLSILNQLNIIDIVSCRRRNALFLFENLKELNSCFFIIKDESIFKKNVPMFLPILLEDRDVVRRKLSDANIFCPVHWPYPPHSLRLHSNSFYEKELSLVIDQRYSICDMQRIINVINLCKA